VSRFGQCVIAAIFAKKMLSRCPMGNNNALAIQLDIQRTGVEEIYIAPRLSASDVPDKNYTVIMLAAVFVLS
jgi:hypothetical protein